MWSLHIFRHLNTAPKVFLILLLTSCVGFPNIITSAAQSAARNKPGGSEIAEAKREVMQSCIRELSITQRQIETHQSFYWCWKTQPEFRSSFCIRTSIQDNQGKRDWYLSEQQSWNQRNPMRRVSARVDMNCVTFVWSLKLACKKHQRGEVNQ